MMKNRTYGISKILKALGVTPANLGYQYARYAIELLIDDPGLVRAICKELYPRCAEHFGTTPSRVERCIRQAIEHGWLLGDPEYQDELFGRTVDASMGKPTNGEFLATVADYCIMTQGG